MFKSHIEELLLVFRCLFQDIANNYPTLRGELVKDTFTLTRLAAVRGLHLFCVDLPNVGKYLDRCVSEGMMSVSGLPLTKRCPKHIMYPEFLQGLWNLVFCEDGRLKEVSDEQIMAYSYLRQVYYLAKKVKLDCSREIVADEVRDFIAVDAELPKPESFWWCSWAHERPEAWYTENQPYLGFSKSEIYMRRASTQGSEVIDLLTKLDLVSGLVSSVLGRYRPDEWCFKHGPGVVSERKGIVNKFEFVNWSDRLEAAFPIADFGFHNYPSWGRWLGSLRSISSHEPSSRMISVQKTLTKPRLIAAEPTEHMWCQQNIWHYLRTRVQESWIADFVRFNDQTRNQDLCKLASKDGTLATLDLSSASDRVSCHFVGQLFRSNIGLLTALRSTRTRYITQNLAHDVLDVIELNKFSTMGNACTFPVESLGFLCVVLAAIVVRRGLSVDTDTLRALSREVAVFGDDLVVPEDSRELIVKGLEVLHFKVNTEKSYWSGNFRESCGVDSYWGVDISPVYWRSLTTSEPESIVSAVEVANSFHKRGLWLTAEHIASTVTRVGLPVVSVDSGVFGFKAFSGPCISGHNRRFNMDLQRDEVRVLAPSARARILEPKDDSVLLQFFTESPEPSLPWKGGIALRPSLRLAMAWVPTHDVVS